MAGDSTRGWIDAAKVLAADASASVSCPECGRGALSVLDTSVIEGRFSRYLICHECGAKNIIDGIKG